MKGAAAHKISSASCLLVLLLCCPAFAASQEDDEEARREARIAAHIVGLYHIKSFSEINVRGLDFGFVGLELAEGVHGGVINLDFGLDAIDTGVTFSFYINNRAYGSPAWDGFALPRTSLNQDPITGWYWWENKTR